MRDFRIASGGRLATSHNKDSPTLRHSLVPPARLASVDPALARRSLSKLADLPVKVVLFGHGRPLQQGAGSAMRELVESL